MSLPSTLVPRIDHIYETTDIYKCAVICDTSMEDALYAALAANLYPVVRMDCVGVQEFLDDKARLLLVPYCQIDDFIDNIDLLKPHLTLVVSASSILSMDLRTLHHTRAALDGVPLVCVYH